MELEGGFETWKEHGLETEKAEEDARTRESEAVMAR
jgi:hypothetical protein